MKQINLGHISYTKSGENSWTGTHGLGQPTLTLTTQELVERFEGDEMQLDSMLDKMRDSLERIRVILKELKK